MRFSKKPTVIVSDKDHIDDHVLERILPVLQEYAQILGVSIDIANPHGQVWEPKTEKGKLFIRFWSVPARSIKTQLATAYGAKLHEVANGSAFEYSGLGDLILDPDGMAVGEVYQGVFYVLFDLPHGARHFYMEDDLMRSLLASYVEYICDPEKYRQGVSKKRRFSLLCNSGLISQKKEAEENLQELDESIRRSQQEIIESVRERTDLNRMLKMLTKMVDQVTTEELYGKYEALTEMVGEHNIQIYSGKIAVNLGQIEIKHEGITYEIGELELHIHPNGEHGGVRVFNKARTNDTIHPHVDSGGDCCLGNISDGVAMLVGEMEFTTVVTLMTEFLRSYNGSSCYSSITSWPVKEGVRNEK